MDSCFTMARMILRSTFCVRGACALKQSASAGRLLTWHGASEDAPRHLCGHSGRTFATAPASSEHPGFTLTAVGVLTLGIGVNAGIFGIINGLMLRPLVGAEAPGELVGVYNHDRTTVRGYRAFFTDPGFGGGLVRRSRRAGRSRTLPLTTLRSPASPKTAPPARRWSTSSAPATSARWVSRRFSAATSRETRNVRAPPALGDRQPRALEAPRLRSRNPDADSPHQRRRLCVIGVAPQGFSGTTAIIGMEFWLPLGVHDAIESDFDSRDRFPLVDRRNHSLLLLGRLKPEITRAQADEQLKVIAAAHEHAYPDENKNQDLVARPLADSASAPARRMTSSCGRRWRCCRDSRPRCC